LRIKLLPYFSFYVTLLPVVRKNMFSFNSATSLIAVGHP